MRRSDYEKLAEKVVDALEDGGSLEEGVVEVAKEKSLNPEQIRRLVELANTAAFLRLFGETSGDDRMVDFDVADPRAVIKKFFDSVPSSDSKSVTLTTSGGTDEDFFADITDELRGLPVEAAGEKDEDPAEAKTASEGTVPMGKFRKLRIEEMLLDKVAAAGYAAEEIASDLARSFRGVYSQSKLAGFEADVVALHKEAAAPPIMALREVLGVKTASIEEAKKSAKNRLVTPTPELAKVAEFVSVVEDFVAAKKALNKLEKL